jgi:diacylglycerol O-acyltransferase / wax synthase
MTFKRLNGMDAMLLYSETPNLHSHTVKVLHMSTESAGGQYSFEDFRRAMEQRLSRLEPLGYRLVDIPWRIHHPMWWPNSDIDLDYHLRRIRVPSPGTQHQLDGLIGEIMSTQLDRSRPLWEFYFVEGMPCQRVAVIAKMHHALADGMASANLLARLMGITDGEADDPGHVYAEAVPSKPRLMAIAARDHAHQLSTLPAFVKDAFRGAMRVRRHSKLDRRGSYNLPHERMIRSEHPLDLVELGGQRRQVSVKHPGHHAGRAMTSQWCSLLQTGEGEIHWASAGPADGPKRHMPGTI